MCQLKIQKLNAKMSTNGKNVNIISEADHGVLATKE